MKSIFRVSVSFLANLWLWVLAVFGYHKALPPRSVELIERQQADDTDDTNPLAPAGLLLFFPAVDGGEPPAPEGAASFVDAAMSKWVAPHQVAQIGVTPFEVAPFKVTTL